MINRDVDKTSKRQAGVAAVLGVEAVLVPRRADDSGLSLWNRNLTRLRQVILGQV